MIIIPTKIAWLLGIIAAVLCLLTRDINAISFGAALIILLMISQYYLYSAYIRRGWDSYWSANYQFALADYNRALKHKRNDAQAYFYRGILLYEIHNAPAALADFQQALSLNSRYWIAFGYRGSVHCSLGNYPAAIDDFNSGGDKGLGSQKR